MQGMLDAIAARGPDGQGLWHADSVILGHCRLSIIDLSAQSDQPLRLENDSHVIVFNGEIYNYRTLRQELEREGEVFFSQGDTEVVLRGFARHGLSWLPKLNGQFAAAVWDKARHKVTLFRDRFGIKPVYWTLVGTTFLFGSQIKSFQSYPGFHTDFNPAWLDEYLTFQNTHGSLTPFKGVMALEPGCALELENGTTNANPICWAPRRLYQPDIKMTEEDAVAGITERFKSAVDSAMVSDVPIGSYLSGGLDSGAITAVAGRLNPKLQVFTCGFHDPALTVSLQELDETAAAKELADYLGLHHQTRLVEAAELPSLHFPMFRTIEEPRVGMLYQNDIAAQLASANVPVCLSGSGGDELFGGYPWRYKTIRNAATAGEFRANYYGFWQRVFRDDEKAALYGLQTKTRDPQASFRIFASYFPDDAGCWDDIGFRTWACMSYESQTFLYGLLQVGDRLAGSYGLEERFPFLDNDLVAFLDTIPAAYHWDPDEKAVGQKYFSGKRLLRRALTTLVPPHIAARKKQGFVLPEAEWYRTFLAPLIRRELCGDQTRLYAYLDRTAIRTLVEEHLSGQKDHHAKIWSLLSVEAILKTLFTSN